MLVQIQDPKVFVALAYELRSISKVRKQKEGNAFVVNYTRNYMSKSRQTNASTESGKTSTQKTDALQEHVEVSSGQALTTNQGVRINDNQNSLKAGERGGHCSKILSCARKSRISITSGFLNGSSMLVATARTATLSAPKRSPI
jgi:hypothetical protein